MTSVAEFTAAVDFNVGEPDHVSWQRAAYFPTALDVIRKMTPDSLHVDTKERKIVIHETFVTDSTNVMRLSVRKRSKNSFRDLRERGLCS